MIAKRDQIDRPQRWDITAEIRAEIVAKLMEIVNGSNPAQSIRAARLLMELDSLNITASAMAQELEAEMKSQILKVLRQRGEG
ncbi:MAG: hypothetical protein KGQ51_18685 [Planctomycetes bacterium]|nr:hypothetical protein [Planctomycetota bacterium]